MVRSPQKLTKPKYSILGLHGTKLNWLLCNGRFSELKPRPLLIAGFAVLLFGLLNQFFGGCDVGIGDQSHN
jgi:hypothetical protein